MLVFANGCGGAVRVGGGGGGGGVRGGIRVGCRGRCEGDVRWMIEICR